MAGKDTTLASTRSELERYIIMRGRRIGKSTLAASWQSLEEMIMEEQAKAMEVAVNFDVLSDILCAFGWTAHEIDRTTDNNHAIDIQEWVKENCKGETKNNGAKWLFELPKDAMWFKLRWL